jgi:DNA-3-methyladenine glycosylase II
MGELAEVSKADLERAAEQLSAHDPVLRPLIKRYGLFTPRPHTDYYRELVSSIIGQQLSVKAAASIEKRFVDHFGGNFPSPGQILATDTETLRSLGFSRAKAVYVTDLAGHVKSGELEIEKLPSLSNEENIKELTAVKGIGEWTVHMFLIFALGRLDILPVGDLGFRSAIKRQYGFEELPTPAQCAELAVKNGWHPFESVATWYLWKSLDNAPVKKL